MIAAASPEQGGLRFDLQVIASWIEPGSRVLDLGCGNGDLLAHLKTHKQVLGTANQATGRWFTDVEDDALGTNHATIGYILARSWGLTENVCQAILCHHDYSVLIEDSALEPESRTLIAVNVVAEYIAGTHLRTRRDAEWDKGREPAAHFLGYPLTELEDLADDIVYSFVRKTSAEAV